VEHVQPLDRPFRWHTAALIAGVLALVGLAGLLAVAAMRLLHARHPAVGTRTAAVAAARMPAKVPTVHPIQPRSHVSVLVLNGNGITHAAGTEASRLLANGYRRTLAADAPTRYARSLVLFRPGWELEARRLARDAGLGLVAPLDGRLPRSEGGYRLVLILGVR
jgi:LytR cell envelope-related transcriptional attenuator